MLLSFLIGWVLTAKAHADAFDNAVDQALEQNKTVDVLYVDTTVTDENRVYMTVFKPANSGEDGAVKIDHGYYGIKEVMITMNYKDVVRMRDAFTRAEKQMRNNVHPFTIGTTMLNRAK